MMLLWDLQSAGHEESFKPGLLTPAGGPSRRWRAMRPSRWRPPTRPRRPAPPIGPRRAWFCTTGPSPSALRRKLRLRKFKESAQTHTAEPGILSQVRLVIAEKGLACEERDVSLPQSEHKEPWFMRLNLGEEVPVIIHRDNIISDYDQIIDYVERTFTGEHVVALMPEAGSPQHARVLQYRELLDALPMDAYTHGCILHPELTTDSMIPKYATAEIRRHLANATTDLMKLDHEEEPQLSEPYLSKQKKLMAKILEHDDVSYLKKILGELAMVLDQIEAELEKRKLENEGQKCELWLCGCAFTLADVLLGATLHRLKFLGLSKKYWEDGSRPNLQSFFERVQRRLAFRKVLGDIHTTLLSAVIPNAFRLVKRKPPSFFGASFLMGSLGGMGYFAYWYLKKKYI
uniref:Ganglioside induced differentiation associated protein 1 like 1 n=6 Tax=Felidae TaxID=9681 RepID=A0ABI7ZV19_FELCA